jgi:hypothetical protein
MASFPALLSFALWFLDRSVLEATNGALDPIERFWPDSCFACLNLHDGTRMQSATRRQFVLANPACRSFSSDVCAQRLPQRIFRDAVW